MRDLSSARASVDAASHAMEPISGCGLAAVKSIGRSASATALRLKRGDSLDSFLSGLSDDQLVVALSAEGAMPPAFRLSLGMIHLSEGADAWTLLGPVAAQCPAGSFARACFQRYETMSEEDVEKEAELLQAGAWQQSSSPLRRRFSFAYTVGLYSSLESRSELGGLSELEFSHLSTWSDTSEECSEVEGVMEPAGETLAAPVTLEEEDPAAEPKSEPPHRPQQPDCCMCSGAGLSAAPDETADEEEFPAPLREAEGDADGDTDGDTDEDENKSEHQHQHQHQQQELQQQRQQQQQQQQ